MSARILAPALRVRKELSKFCLIIFATPLRRAEASRTLSADPSENEQISAQKSEQVISR
jgi:hypothetical protein